MGIVPAYGTGAGAEKDPKKNVCYRFTYTTGDSTAWEDADHVFEDTFVNDAAIGKILDIKFKNKSCDSDMLNCGNTERATDWADGLNTWKSYALNLSW